MFVPPQYTWMTNTISDLAAQGLPNRWMMQLGFVGFGALLTGALVHKFVQTKQVSVADILILLYGVCVLSSGFFSAKPFLEGVSYSAQEHQLHSLFAQAAGVLFSIAILARLISSRNAQERTFHALFLILIIGTSMLFGLAKGGDLGVGMGVIQRVLYALGFFWLLVSQSWSSEVSRTRKPA